MFLMYTDEFMIGNSALFHIIKVQYLHDYKKSHFTKKLKLALHVNTSKFNFSIQIIKLMFLQKIQIMITIFIPQHPHHKFIINKNSISSISKHN